MKKPVNVNARREAAKLFGLRIGFAAAALSLGCASVGDHSAPKSLKPKPEAKTRVEVEIGSEAPGRVGKAISAPPAPLASTTTSPPSSASAVSAKASPAAAPGDGGSAARPGVVLDDEDLATSGLGGASDPLARSGSASRNSTRAVKAGAAAPEPASGDAALNAARIKKMRFDIDAISAQIADLRRNQEAMEEKAVILQNQADRNEELAEKAERDAERRSMAVSAGPTYDAVIAQSYRDQANLSKREADRVRTQLELIPVQLNELQSKLDKLIAAKAGLEKANRELERLRKEEPQAAPDPAPAPPAGAPTVPQPGRRPFRRSFAPAEI